MGTEEKDILSTLMPLAPDSLLSGAAEHVLWGEVCSFIKRNAIAFEVTSENERELRSVHETRT